jgi:hypothetical protein
MRCLASELMRCLVGSTDGFIDALRNIHIALRTVSFFGLDLYAGMGRVSRSVAEGRSQQMEVAHELTFL